MMHKQTCVSESARRFTHEKSSVPLAKLIAVANAVDFSKFENVEPGRLRRELEVDAETPVLLSVGRLSKQKGLQHLLRAMPEVHKEISNARLVLVGAGEDEAALKDLTGELGLEGAVSFLGWRSEIPEFLKDTDLLVLPSLWEGMPNVILEAMACGVPAVATEVGGTPELVSDGETGFLVPPADSDALARSIITLLQDRELRTRMGQQAHELARSKFSPERMIERNEQLYTELLNPGLK
jgi:glycosyltransferase involved in cell wall biosynthesis